MSGSLELVLIHPLQLALGAMHSQQQLLLFFFHLHRLLMLEKLILARPKLSVIDRPYRSNLNQDRKKATIHSPLRQVELFLNRL